MAHSSYRDISWTGTIESDSFLGQQHVFNVKDYLTSRLNPASIGSATCRAVLCINKSGGTLARGSLILPTSTASYGWPLGCHGVASTTLYVGAVSPWVATTTVADGAAFWCILEGVTKLAHSGTGNVLQGSRLEQAATGRCTLYSSGTTCGVSREASNAPAAGTLFHAYLFSAQG